MINMGECDYRYLPTENDLKQVLAEIVRLANENVDLPEDDRRIQANLERIGELEESVFRKTAILDRENTPVLRLLT